MTKLRTFVIVSAALATVAVSAASPALAGDRYYPRHHHDRGRNDAAALGLFGLAAGVVVGAAIASQPRYAEPAPVYVEPSYPPPPPPRAYPRPVYSEYPQAPGPYAGGLEPWSPAWYRYCSQRYRSFDSRSGTYTGYDGRDHFCEAG